MGPRPFNHTAGPQSRTAPDSDKGEATGRLSSPSNNCPQSRYKRRPPLCFHRRPCCRKPRILRNKVVCRTVMSCAVAAGHAWEER
ncbi:hypothetical protein ACQJBY_022614 [Aegilops geniculata]